MLATAAYTEAAVKLHAANVALRRALRRRALLPLFDRTSNPLLLVEEEGSGGKHRCRAEAKWGADERPGP